MSRKVLVLELSGVSIWLNMCRSRQWWTFEQSCPLQVFRCQVPQYDNQTKSEIAQIGVGNLTRELYIFLIYRSFQDHLEDSNESKIHLLRRLRMLFDSKIFPQDQPEVKAMVFVLMCQHFGS
jgi:hypothetical protein